MLRLVLDLSVWFYCNWGAGDRAIRVDEKHDGDRAGAPDTSAEPVGEDGVDGRLCKKVCRRFPTSFVWLAGWVREYVFAAFLARLLSQPIESGSSRHSTVSYYRLIGREYKSNC